MLRTAEVTRDDNMHDFGMSNVMVWRRLAHQSDIRAFELWMLAPARRGPDSFAALMDKGRSFTMDRARRTQRGLRSFSCAEPLINCAPHRGNLDPHPLCVGRRGV